MTDSIEDIISQLENTPPFEGERTIGGRQVIRVKPDDCAVVTITRWILHRDGNCTPNGKDILVKRKTEYGRNVLYVNYRHPDTQVLSNSQVIYKITLS